MMAMHPVAGAAILTDVTAGVIEVLIELAVNLPAKAKRSWCDSVTRPGGRTMLFPTSPDDSRE